MNLNLSETIRRFRKERGLTQEQLAEALDVSVGAVSKWELGSAAPDLSRLVELAEFFETSVDVLLGYELQGGGLKKSLAEIKRCRMAKARDEGKAVVEKALRQYPNSFEIVYQSAVFFRLLGVEQRDDAFLRRALTLYERAVTLFSQNTDSDITRFGLQNAVAQIYQALGDSEAALHRLKESNVDRHNNGYIGLILSLLHRPDEALPYLSDALAIQLTNLFELGIGFANALLDNGTPAAALEIVLWILEFLERAKYQDRVTYFDKLTATLFLACAQLSDNAEDRRAYLRRAMNDAELFDAAPDYTFEVFRFYYGNQHNTAFDDLGVSVTEVIRTAAAQDAALYSEWERIQNEKKAT